MSKQRANVTLCFTFESDQKAAHDVVIFTVIAVKTPLFDTTATVSKLTCFVGLSVSTSLRSQGREEDCFA